MADVLNIGFSAAQDMISKYTSQGKSISDAIQSVRSTISVNVMGENWKGGGADEFSHWFTSEYVKAAEELAAAAIPGFGNALTSMLNIYQQAETNLTSIVSGFESVCTF